MQNQTVYFFTQNVNISFVENEINNLSKTFKNVVVCTFKKNNENYFPSNVEIVKADYINYKAKVVFFSHFFLIANLATAEFFRTTKYLFNPKKYLIVLSELLRSIYLSDWIKQQALFKQENNVYCSFWFNQWATALAVLVKQKDIKNFVSRVHGADLFEERVPVIQKLPFRKFQLKYISKVFSVSKNGELYLKNKYSNYSDKIFTSYLGTKYYYNNPFDEKNIFTIVSCAKIRNIKRIHLLAEIVSLMDFPIKWIHIGDENLNSNDLTITTYKKNKEKVLANKNIDLVLTGNLTNEQVFKLYKSTPINLFVSVSETEGLPVSMMEAISFGIPILSTDVGGCNEIVTDKTGVLIPKDFEVVNVVEAILNFKKSKKNTAEFRQGVQSFWEQNYNGEQNYNAFILNVTSLN